MKEITRMFIITLVLLIGCSNEEGSKNKHDREKEMSDDATETHVEASPKDTIPKPPGLIISAGKETIKPTLGTYSWDVANDNGIQSQVDAGSFAPPQLVANHRPTNVTPATDIHLEFEKQPQHYSIRIWNDDNSVRSSSKKIDLSKQTGSVIFEVLADWEEGTASYSFLLNVEQDG